MKQIKEIQMMRRLLKQSGIALIVSLLGFSACHNTNYPGYKKGDGDMLYKIYVSHEGPKAKPGDFLSVQMDYRTNEDSLLFNSYGKTFPLELVEPVFPGDINTALSLMAKGDSASFVIRADSFLLRNAKMAKLPAFVSEDSKIIFNIKLHNIQTLEDIEAQQVLAQQQAQQQEAESMLAYAQHYMPEVAKRPSGLYVQTTKHGKGRKAKIGSRVKLHYTGKFLNGKTFASSYDNKQPAHFTVGRGEVIAGWDEAVSLMRQGDEAVLLMPSSIAYKQGRGDIPANTPIVFEVKLLEVK